MKPRTTKLAKIHKRVGFILALTLGVVSVSVATASGPSAKETGEAAGVALDVEGVDHSALGESSGGPMSSVQPTIMLIVRGLKSKLPQDEMERRYKERMPRFREVSGLVQKYYSFDEATGEWAGIYLWDSEESLAAYLESDLKKTIPSAYELTGPPQIERFDIVDILRK